MISPDTMSNIWALWFMGLVTIALFFMGWLIYRWWKE